MIRDAAFVPTSNVSDKGFSFSTQRRDAPAMRFATRGQVDITGSASGSTDAAASAISQVDAGLRIGFKRQGAVVFVMDPAEDEFVRDVDAMSEWMQSQYG